MNRFFLLLFCFLYAPLATAAELRSTPVKNDVATATLITADDHLVPGQPLWVALHLDLPEDWHTYWINPGDTGLAVTVTPEVPSNVTLGPIHWPVPQRFEVAGLINYGYHDEALLLMPLELASSANLTTIPLKLKANWLVCKDICIPESAELSLDIPVSATPDADVSSRFADAIIALPKPMKNLRYNFNKDQVWIELPGEHSTESASIFPITDTIVSFTELPKKFVKKNHTIYLFARGVQPDKNGFTGVVVSPEGEAGQFDSDYDATLEYPAEKMAPCTPPASFFFELILAFLGGLVLNLMPCVLPVLSLKVLGLVKKAGLSRRAAAMQGVAYTSGIILSFLAVAGLLLILQQSGAALGWGYQLQSPLFVLSLTAIMFAVGLNLSGVFELPGVIGSLGQEQASKDTLLGSFLTGVLATLVATPCTAPFMASAIGIALTLSAPAALSIFAMIGFGLAFPYLLISLFPTLRRWLPKPGLWMESLRQFLAFPMYATAAWLLWVLTTQTGADALALALALLLLIAFAAWLLRRTSHRLMRVAVIALLLVLGGVIFAQIKEVSGTAAPASMTMPQGAVAYSAEKLAALRAEGKAVFVDVTANWCITCKINERVALSSSTVQQHFRDHQIQTMMADWTNRDPAITAYLAQFGRSGVPTYVYYPPSGEPVLLPQLLTPASVVAATAP